jgi:hypothetical protein
MALSAIEDRYLSALTEREYPTFTPEQSAMAAPEGVDGMQLAAGPSATMSDAGGGMGEMKAFEPTTRQRIASFLQSGFEGMGIDRARARRNAETLIGGPSSNLPLTLGLADLVPFLGTGLQLEEGVEMGKEAVQAADQGNYGQAALLGAGAALSVAPGVVPTVKAGKALITETGKQLNRAIMEGTGPLASVVPQSVRPLNIVQPGPGVVSTRLPTAVKATEDPMASTLVIDLQAAKRDPEAFNHNVGLIKQYPNFASKARNPERQADDFIEGVKDNLIFLHDQVPDATRQRSKLWYDGARTITDKFAGEYNVPDQAVAGVMAVLSPQKDWFMNVSLGQRVLDIMSKQQSARWDSSMDEVGKIIWSKPQYAPMVDAIRGKTLAEIQDPGLKAMWLRTYDQAKNPREHQIVSPEGDFVGVRTNKDGKTPTQTGWGSLNEIGKAVVIFQDPSVETISRNLGQQHKVRNFYNNIYAPGDPAGHVTIDTHAVAAGLLRPLSGNSREVMHNFGSGMLGEVGPKNSSITGVQGTYGLYAEAYRRAAQERGILPREMQSITWEAVRGLYPDTFKSQAKNVEQVDGIWLQYRKGKLSLDEARNEVLRAAGGIDAPEWERSGLRPQSPQAVQPAVDPRQLPGAGVSGGSASGSGRVQPATGNPATVNRGRSAPNQGAN